MEWWLIIAVFVVGFICGFINTLAGNGSAISLPMLIFCGLPANVANGTNRIAILLQTIVGVASFKKQNLFDFKNDVKLAIPSIFGAIIGAFIAIKIDQHVMEQTIGFLLVALIIIIIYNPEKWVKQHTQTTLKKLSITQIIIFFFIGLYGGFIQAGVGFFLLAGLVLSAGYNLVRANAVKLLITLFFTLFALIIFIMNHLIDYKIGFILATGSMLGAWVAANVAVAWGPKVIRWFLLLMLFFSAIKLIGGF